MYKHCELTWIFVLAMVTPVALTNHVLTAGVLRCNFRLLHTKQLVQNGDKDLNGRHFLFVMTGRETVRVSGKHY